MSWSMPNTGQWNPAMGIAPYSVKEWTDMQQHNWQEWVKWQQQYTQWHHQYGDEYAQQYQTMQHMANMSVLLPMSTALPPAPPPPEKPPPPPPHENDQPLFVQPQAQPVPVPPPVPNQQWNSSNYINTNLTTINTPKWSTADKEPAQKVNADALKKLAEEERLFDIQFKKWEDEIEKWRKENNNHPDKEAYKEYEKKFETCRAQLMERRNQMKLKRAKLLGTLQPTNTAIPSNIPSTTAPLQQSVNIIKYNSGAHSQNTTNQQNSTNQQNYKNSTNQQNVQTLPKQKFEQFNKSPFMDPKFNSSHSANKKPNNKNIDPQDRYESYQQIDEDSSSYQIQQPATSFLPTSSSNKSIPGLDLVPETDNMPTLNKNQEIIDITDDNEKSCSQASQQQPDYSTISKGINSILGDEKIMNILSMVCNSNTTNVPISYPNISHNNTMNSQYFSNPGQSTNVLNESNPGNNQISLPLNSSDRIQNSSNNQQQKNRQIFNSSTHQDQDVNSRRPPQIYNETDENISQHGQHYANYGNNVYGADQSSRSHPYENGQSHNVQPLLKQNVPPVRPPFQDISRHQNVDDYSRDHSDKRNIKSNMNPLLNQPLQPKWPEPPQPKWLDEPLFAPSIIVEYEHKPLRLKARDFIEPVHMFDYNHKSKNSDSRKIDLKKEVEELFPKQIRWEREDNMEIDTKFKEQNFSRHYERRPPKDDFKEDYLRAPSRFDFERRWPEDRYDDRRYDRALDDQDSYLRQDDYIRETDWDREFRKEDSRNGRDFKKEESRDIFKDDKDFNKDNRYFRREDRDYKWEERDLKRDDSKTYKREDSRDYRRDDNRNHSRSREREYRKRGHSHDSNIETMPKVPKGSETSDFTRIQASHIVMIDDILEPPGREMRPQRIVIILRGVPGSGKSYLAKLIRDKEFQHGGTARIMSIDDYFMVEGEVEEKDPVSGKIIKKPTLKYEYDAAMEDMYLNSLKRAFKRSVSDGYFSFLIYDAINESLKSYADVWNFARQKGFQVYICTMDTDIQTCFKRNIHNRTLEDIEEIKKRFLPLPAHHIQLDATTLLQNAAIPEVHMEDVKDDIDMVEIEEFEVENVFTSKWEKMDTSEQLARLDGISKPLRPSQFSMEDYLQLDDWQPNKAKPGKKTVRWADIEERREQEKMRAIGFVVGQTDWNRMTDPTLGSSALTQTKYIERVRRN